MYTKYGSERAQILMILPKNQWFVSYTRWSAFNGNPLSMTILLNINQPVLSLEIYAHINNNLCPEILLSEKNNLHTFTRTHKFI